MLGENLENPRPNETIDSYEFKLCRFKTGYQCKEVIDSWLQSAEVQGDIKSSFQSIIEETDEMSNMKECYDCHEPDCRCQCCSLKREGGPSSTQPPLIPIGNDHAEQEHRVNFEEIETSISEVTIDSDKPPTPELVDVSNLTYFGTINERPCWGGTFMVPDKQVMVVEYEKEDESYEKILNFLPRFDDYLNIQSFVCCEETESKNYIGFQSAEKTLHEVLSAMDNGDNVEEEYREILSQILTAFITIHRSKYGKIDPYICPIYLLIY